LLDENDGVLVENTITSTIASGATFVVNFSYASPTPGFIPLKARVVIAGDAVPENNTSAPNNFKIFPGQPMTYVIDSDNFGGGWRYNQAAWVHLAFRYPAAAMGEFVGRELTGMYYAVRSVATCIVPPTTVWVRTGSLDNPKVLLGTHNNIIEGWNYCEFATPYILTNEETYIGVSYFAYPDDWYNALLNEKEEDMPKDFDNAMFATATNEGEEPIEEDWLAGGQDFGNNVLIAVVSIPRCPEPTSFNVVYERDAEDINCLAAVLTWSAPAKEDITYNVYRGSARIGTTTETTFRDETFTHTQGYRWSVAAVCPEGGESARVGQELTPCKESSIKEIVKTAFTIVPNPAKDRIKISAESNFNKVEVINFLGQTVITQNNDTNNTTLDVSNLTNGVYFVRIITDNGTNVQKFVKQ
jgi:hypothetical protein